MTRIIYSFNRAGGGGLAPTFWGGKLYITLTEYLFIFFIFFYKSSPPNPLSICFRRHCTQEIKNTTWQYHLHPRRVFTILQLVI